MKVISVLAIALCLFVGAVYIALPAEPSDASGAAYATLGNVGVLLDQTYSGNAVSAAIPIASGPYNGMNNFKVEFSPVAGNVSACTAFVDSSIDGRSWTQGGAISAQTCTTEGAAAGGPIAANFVRLDLAVTGGKVRVRLLGGMSSLRTAGLFLPIAGGTMTGPIVGNESFTDLIYGPMSSGLSLVDASGNFLNSGQSVSHHNDISIGVGGGSAYISMTSANGGQFALSTSAGSIASTFAVFGINDNTVGGIIINETGAGGISLSGGAAGVIINSGTNTIYRCTSAGTLPIGALTTVAADCGASTATALTIN